VFRGAIFDVDGVLVDSPHERAWRDSLDELMEGEWRGLRDRTTWTPGAFTTLVYQTYVSGKPRLAGALAALEHFGVPDLAARAQEYADRKQEMIVRLIDAGEFTAFPDALRFIVAVRDAGLATAAASSSKNADRFLAKVRMDDVHPDLAGKTLLDLFDVDVSGRDFAHGKPAPEMFLTAARELGVEPAHAIVLEDAPAGIQAAEAGEMASIAVARRPHDAELLEGAGADLVVATLDDVDVDALRAGRLRARPPTNSA
jgi:beta-phosphoglucomutase-like phosphatase (HAD superfamily)